MHARFPNVPALLLQASHGVTCKGPYLHIQGWTVSQTGTDSSSCRLTWQKPSRLHYHHSWRHQTNPAGCACQMHSAHLVSMQVNGSSISWMGEVLQPAAVKMCARMLSACSSMYVGMWPNGDPIRIDHLHPYWFGPPACCPVKGCWPVSILSCNASRIGRPWSFGSWCLPQLGRTAVY